MMSEVFDQGDKDLPRHRSGRIENRRKCENLLAAEPQKVGSLLANKRYSFIGQQQAATGKSADPIKIIALAIRPSMFATIR